MIRTLLRCQRCGHTFQIDFLDREDPDERDMVGGPPPRCPKCHTRELEPLQKTHVRRPR